MELRRQHTWMMSKLGTTSVQPRERKNGLFTGRPARAIVNRFMREVGPISDLTPEFPLATAALAPLRAKSEMAGSADFTPLWSGQAARLSRELPAADLTRQLAAETLENLRLLQTMV